MTTIVLTAILALTVAAAGNAHRAGERPPGIDRFAWAVAVCETAKGHNHPDFEHRSGSYGGAWGWYVGTWQLDRATRTWRDKKTGKWKGYPRFPWNATPAQQYRTFLVGRARHRYWGCIANGGYRHHM